MKNRKNWKRLMALAVSAAMLVPAAIVPAAETDAVLEAAQAGTVMETVEAETDLEAVSAANDFVIDEKGVLTSYSGKGTAVTIPSGVTDIADKAFSGCTSMTSVTIPFGVCGIGKYAFSGCTGLTGVTIPNSVTYMGDYAFSGCTGLKSAVLPNDMLNIGGYAFSGCTGLSSVTIPKGMEYVLNGAFSGCTGLKSVTLPDGMRSIGNDAFLNCSNLTSITIPDSVVTIGDRAFSGCGKLTIYGNAGSKAESHAKSNKITFVDLAKIQTIQYTTTFNKVYGNKPFLLKAKLTKGNGTLSYTSSNKKVVTVSESGKVTIKGTGIAVITVKASETAQYDEKSVKVTIKVRPAKQKKPTVVAKTGKKLKVTWKRDTKATGYQIQYSTDQKFKNKSAARIKSVAKNSKVSVTISKLKAGKRYYVRVRSYKSAKLNGKAQKLYGTWSSANSIKAIK